MANEVRVLITADDRATATIKNVAGGVLAAEAAMKGLNLAMGGLKSSVSAAMGFEKAISSVGAVAGATKDQLKGISDTALRIGKDTQFGAREAAGAMEVLAANGITATEIMGGAADAAATLAAAGGTNLAQAADTVSTSMAVWGASTQDLTEYVNRLAGAANVSRFGVEDMSAAIAQGGGVAAASGVGFDDFTTAIAATSKAFASGSDAGTSFKTFLQRLAAPTDEAKEAMKELGINAFDATGQMLPMGQIVQQLHDSLGALSEEQRTQAAATIFGSDAMRTAVTLAGLTREEFDKLSQTMKDTSAMDVAKERTDNLAGAWEQLKGAIETIQIEIGQRLLPVLAELATWAAEKLPQAFAWIEREWGPAFRAAGEAAMFLAGQLGSLGGWLSEHEELARALADGIAIATAGMIAFGVAAAAAALLNPFTATILAVEALTVATVMLVQNWDELRDKYEMIDGLSIMAVAAFEGTAEAIGAVDEALRGADDAFQSFIQWCEDLPGATEEAVGDLGNLLYDAGRDMIDGLWEGAKSKWEDFKGWLGDLPGEAVDWIKDQANGHSPWGITEPLGEDLVAGIEVGVNNAIPSLDAAVRAGIDGVMQGATQVLQSHLSNTIAGVQVVLGGYNVGNGYTAEDYARSVGLTLGADGSYVPDPMLQGPFLGMSPGDIEMANRKAREAIAAMGRRTYSGGGDGGSSGKEEETAADSLAAAIAEATRNASLALSFGELGGKAMETFLDAFANPKRASGLPDAVKKLVSEAEAAGVPQADLLGSNILQAMLDAFAGTGAVSDVEWRLSDLTKATEKGLKDMLGKATKLLQNAPLAEATKDSLEKMWREFSRALDNGEKISGDKLKDFLDKITDATNDGWDTLKTTTVDKLEDWLDSVTDKLRDGKPETAAQFRSMLEGLEGVLKSAPLPESMRDFADSTIELFLQAIREGKGLALADLEAFIAELIQRAREGRDAAIAEAGGGSSPRPDTNGPPLGEPAANTPTGAYGAQLVWDEGRKAWVYPWDVGGSIPTGAQRLGTVTVNIGTVIATDKGQAAQASGDLAFSLAAAGAA